MIKKGDLITVEVTSLNSEGKGISKTDEGFVIFSEKTLPGDTAQIRIKKKKSNYAEAVLVELVKPSEFRTAARCSHFGVCGGCKIQNYSYDKQLEFKTVVVQDALQRIGGFDIPEILPALGSTEVFYYRNKMEYSFPMTNGLMQRTLIMRRIIMRWDCTCRDFIPRSLTLKIVFCSLNFQIEF